MDLTGRSLLTLLDFTGDEITYLLDLAATVRNETRAGLRRRRFEGYTLAMLFEKRSTRTRAAFETAFGEEGGHPAFLTPADIQLGEKETIDDTARVLGRMFDLIQFRGFQQSSAETLAARSGVPVINGLTDSFHPTQALADMLTVRDEAGTLAGTVLTYIGDARNNVAASLLVASAKLGIALELVCPDVLSPPAELVARTDGDRAASGGSLRIAHDPTALNRASCAIYTDVWVSMGEEERSSERVKLLTPFRVTESTMSAAPDAVFLHCLPAVRGNEMNAAVIDGARSRVFDQAENRKHTIKAVMLASLGLA